MLWNLENAVTYSPAQVGQFYEVFAEWVIAMPGAVEVVRAAAGLVPVARGHQLDLSALTQLASGHDREEGA